MIDALPSRLPFSLRRSGGLVMPFFQTVRAKRIYRFSVNFLRFPPFFDMGVPLKKSPLSHSSLFAPLVQRISEIFNPGPKRFGPILSGSRLQLATNTDSRPTPGAMLASLAVTTSPAERCVRASAATAMKAE